MLIRTVFALDRPFLDKALNFFNALRAVIFHCESIKKSKGKSVKQARFVCFCFFLSVLAGIILIVFDFTSSNVFPHRSQTQVVFTIIIFPFWLFVNYAGVLILEADPAMDFIAL